MLQEAVTHPAAYGKGISRVENIADISEVTLQDAIVILGVPESTLHRWIKEERLQKGYVSLDGRSMVVLPRPTFDALRRRATRRGDSPGALVDLVDEDSAALQPGSMDFDLGSIEFEPDSIGVEAGSIDPPSPPQAGGVVEAALETHGGGVSDEQVALEDGGEDSAYSAALERIRALERQVAASRGISPAPLAGSTAPLARGGRLHADGGEIRGLGAAKRGAGSRSLRMAAAATARTLMAVELVEYSFLRCLLPRSIVNWLCLRDSRSERLVVTSERASASRSRASKLRRSA